MKTIKEHTQEAFLKAVDIGKSTSKSITLLHGEPYFYEDISYSVMYNYYGDDEQFDLDKTNREIKKYIDECFLDYVGKDKVILYYTNGLRKKPIGKQIILRDNNN